MSKEKRLVSQIKVKKLNLRIIGVIKDLKLSVEKKLEKIKNFLDENSEIFMIRNDDFSGFFCAFSLGKKEIAEFILQNIISRGVFDNPITYESEFASKSLFFCSYYNKKELADKIINSALMAGIFDDIEESKIKFIKESFYVSVKYSDKKMVEFILTKVIQSGLLKKLLTLKDEFGTIIHSIFEYDIEIVKLIFDESYKINILEEIILSRNQDGNTVLHQACLRGKLEVVELLINKSIEAGVLNNLITSKNIYGKTAFDFIFISRIFNEKIFNLLIEYGADLTVQNNWGRTNADYLKNDILREKCKKLELAYEKIKPIMEKILSDETLSDEQKFFIENSDSLSDEEKKSFSNIGRVFIIEAISKDEFYNAIKITKFLQSINCNIIDARNLEIMISQYEEIKSWEYVKRSEKIEKELLKLLSISDELSCYEVKIAISKNSDLSLSISEFRKNFLKLDLHKTSEIYKKLSLDYIDFCKLSNSMSELLGSDKNEDDLEVLKHDFEKASSDSLVFEFFSQFDNECKDEELIGL